jgi:hypothetical protein
VESAQAQPGPWATELDLCRAWTQLPRSVRLLTRDGRAIDLIHLGTWTHGLGPDFRDALVSIDNGPVQSGSIELHLRSRGWVDHGHHLDPAYNSVILHVVGQFDAVDIRRADGRLIPTLLLNVDITGPATRPIDWSLVGGTTCAPSLAADDPETIRAIAGRLGDARMNDRVALVEADLALAPPDAVFYRWLMDAFGYSRNQAAMAAVVERAPWNVVASVCQQGRNTFASVSALLLGAGGYLPLSDTERDRAGLDPTVAADIERKWHQARKRLAIEAIPPTTWELARLRPANHPALRLVQAASLVASADGQPAGVLLDCIRDRRDPTSEIAELVGRNLGLRIGDDRARAIVINVVLPFGYAMSSHTGDQELAACAAELWEALPGAESNERTRRATRQITGDIGIRRQVARIQQGLIHLDRTLCGPRRCYECPIAAAVLIDGPKG